MIESHFSVIFLLFSPPKLAKEVREILSLIEGQMEQALANSLFPVYLSLQAIHKDKAFLQKRSDFMFAPLIYSNYSQRF